jgi:glyoxylase-like metal-dependent hydrolase (beta-lactamase superfamily II)
VRLLRIAPEVWVGISAAWQTTHTICGAGGALVIDGPVLPVEVAALAADARPEALIATHADWDHLLAPLAFPRAHRMAGRATIDRLRADRGAIDGALAAWDAARGEARRALPDWTAAEALTAPGRIDSPIGPIAVAATPGHASDGIAMLLTEPGILIAGDYLSPREIPALDAGAGCAEYLASITRLAALLARARWVVPGHGWPLGAARARMILAEDRRYIEALADGQAPRAPRAAADPAQQFQHRANRDAARGP